jgi:sugar/nucleoside kinase (ribokinase family)
MNPEKGFDGVQAERISLVREDFRCRAGGAVDLAMRPGPGCVRQAQVDQRGARLVIVKLGADGAWYDGDGGAGHVPAVPVAQVVDTVGAGDGFAVGVISGLLEGLPVADAVRRGTWVGARAVQVRGDTEGLPTRAELDAAGLPS